MNKKKAKISLVLLAVITIFLTYTVTIGIGKTGTGAMRNIILGLDLSGGVSITYEASGDENPSAEDMSDTIYKLQQRVQGYSTEAQVYQEGSNRINIEIPGVSDANAILEELGKPGSLEFRLTDGTVVLTGNQVANAEAKQQQDNMGNREFVVQLELTEDGTKAFADATSENVGNVIQIVYDDNVISAPRVNEAITGGTAIISGMANAEEAQNLASSIRIGSLSLELTEIRSNVVGAQLGENAIRTSLIAGAIGLAIVIIFMIFVYALPGICAGIALIIYTLLILLTLNAFDLTLTLPGIAGIILSIGMAVDANVIIYARIREEIAAGISVQGAIQSGFKKALSAILDGNITTLIAAFVLNAMGTGSVKGFAQTLALGIVISMFTALVITRLILNAFYAVGLQSEKLFGRARDRKPVNFLSRKAVFFAISIVLIVAGFVFMGVNKGRTGQILNYSLEFMGGTSTNVSFNENLSIEDIDANVVPMIEKITGDGNVQTQKVQGSNEVIFKTRTLNVDEREELNKIMEENFGVDKEKITAETISSTISGEMRREAVIAVVIATVCMLIYIWFRFKDIRFGASAVAALIHDVLVVLAFYAAVRVSVGSTFIACMLTIVGYSINATIVIFDRIRENIGLEGKSDLSGLVNKSITQTLTRSIFTSLTTFIMVAVLYILGVSSIREFALPLMVGIICGTYSSVCITGALWFVLRTKIKGKTKGAAVKAKSR